MFVLLSSTRNCAIHAFDARPIDTRTRVAAFVVARILAGHRQIQRIRGISTYNIFRLERDRENRAIQRCSPPAGHAFLYRVLAETNEAGHAPAGLSEFFSARERNVLTETMWKGNVCGR